MKIVTIRKDEGITCSLCKKKINKEEYAFQFFNSKSSNKKAHFFIGAGMVHFRHPLCQYNKQNRGVPFEEWFKKIQAELFTSSIRDECMEIYKNGKSVSQRTLER